MPENLLHVSPAHPAFDGHFPGQPILPGVVLLDAVICAIEACGQSGSADFVLRHRLAACKFHHPAGPGAALAIGLEFKASGGVAFSVTAAEDGQRIASGSFVATGR